MAEVVADAPASRASFAGATSGAAAGFLAVVLASAGALAAGLFVPRAAPVWYPLLAATFVAVVFGLNLSKAGARLFEVGLVYAAVVWLYACYPLIGFLANGLEYGPLNDSRLFAATPAPADVARIGWFFVAHLLVFVGAYWWARSSERETTPESVGRIEGLLLFLLVIGTQLGDWILGQQYQWDFASNQDRYVALARLPRLTAQIAGHLDGIRFTAEIALLVFLFQRWKRYRLVILAWLSVTALRTFVERQSRTELVLLCFASLILFDAFVHRIRISGAITLALAGLLGFAVLGVRRMETSTVSEVSWARRLFVGNEFESVFANAFDLDDRVRSGTLGPLPGGLRATDVLALAPQQLLPFEKAAPADWYIRTMFPEAAEKGVGLAFGTVAEAIIGHGWPEVLARGAALGFILAFVDRAIKRRRGTSFWWYVFGVWLTVQIYHSIRSTTFSFLASAWYRFLPVVLVIGAGGWLLRMAGHRRTPRPGT